MKTLHFIQFGGKPKETEIRNALIRASKKAQNLQDSVVVKGNFKKGDLNYIKKHFKLTPCMKKPYRNGKGDFYCEFEVPFNKVII